jgi:hypothetical protein
VTTSTWSRDSHGLFDYETKQLVRDSFQVDGPGFISRLTNECFFETHPIQDSTRLAEVFTAKGISKAGQSYIKTCDNSSDWGKVWVSLRSMRGLTNFKLTKGDYLKVGRKQFYVKQMSVDPGASETYDLADKKGHQEVSSSFICSPSASRSQPASCRICLFDEITYENPLISPCDCAGTMRYIHLMCLREWLRNRMKTRQTGRSLSYYWKALNCELCKAVLPSSVSVNDRFIELMSIPRPETPFILLEDLSRDDNLTRGMHMISMLPNSEIKLVRLTQGRGHECDIRVEDISVSRNQALIKMKDRSFCVEDCKSKFGTLILAKRPLKLRKGTCFTVQINRTLLNLSVKQPKKGLIGLLSLVCCSRKSAQLIDSAYIYKTDDEDSQYNSRLEVSADKGKDVVDIGTFRNQPDPQSGVQISMADDWEGVEGSDLGRLREVGEASEVGFERFQDPQVTNLGRFSGLEAAERDCIEEQNHVAFIEPEELDEVLFHDRSIMSQEFLVGQLEESFLVRSQAHDDAINLDESRKNELLELELL